MSRRLRKAASASVSLLTAASLLLQTSYAVYAQAVVADPSAPAANLPQVTTAGNGVPLVNIAAPNGSGLSHNKFSDFNVGTQGLILNNARTIGQSQLGGMVVANPNLAASPEARLILNEVTSTNPSLLQGATEVHGARADYILANPNGITCNGCGFIGTPRATLTTGAPVLDPATGALTGLSVDRGMVTIGAMGLDARQTDYFDIISRGLAINGVLHGQDVSVITGRNDVDYATRAVKAVKADDGSEKPEFSIDSSALGGMYAGRIALEGTEAGVGVRTPQNMSAGGGGMVLTADGKLVLQKTVSQGAIKARSRSADVTVKGNLHAGTSLELQGATAIRVLEHVVAGAQRDVTLKSGGDVSLKGDVLAAGLAGDGSASQSTGNLGIEAGGNVDVAASQTLSAGETITLTGGGSLASGGKITGGSLSIQLGGGQPGAGRNALTTSTDSLLLARSGPLTISAGDWTHAGTAGAVGDATITLSGALASSGGSLILAQGGALGLSAAAMDHAGKLEADSSLTLTLAGNLAARSGSLMAAHAGSMAVNAANWTHGGEATASGALTAGLSGALNTQTDSLILAQGGNLTLNAGSWSHAGQAAASGTIRAVLSGSLETHAASLVQAQAGALDLRAASWQHAGEASAHTALTAAIGGAVQTTAESLLLAGAEGLALAAGSLAHAGQAGAAGSVTVTLAGDGTVASGGRLIANSGSLTLDAVNLAHAGELAAGAALALRLRGALDSAAGSIILADGGSLQLEATRWTHAGEASAGGRVTAVIGGAVETLAESLILADGGDLDLTAATLTHGGQAGAAGSIAVTLTGDGAVLSGGRLIASGGSLTVDAASLAHAGELVGQKDLSLRLRGALSSAAGSVLLAEDGALALEATRWTHAGQAGAGGRVSAVIGGAVETSGASLILAEGGDLDLTAASLAHGGQAGAASDVAVTLSGDGAVLSGARLTASSGSLTLEAANLAHAGELAGPEGVSLRLRGALDSAAGSIILAERGNLLLEATRWTHAGQAGAGGRVSADAGGAIETATGSLILADGGDLTLQGASLTHGGQAGAAGNVAVTLSGAMRTLAGSLLAAEAGDLDLAAGSWIHNGQATASGSLNAHLSGALATQKDSVLLASGGRLDLTAESWGHAGQAGAATGLKAVFSADVDTGAGSLIHTGSGSLDLSAANWRHAAEVNASGGISADLSGSLTTASGSVLSAASGNMDVAAAGWTHRGAAGAGGNIVAVLTAGLVTLAGSLVSAQAGDLSVTAASWSHAGEAGATGSITASLSGAMDTSAASLISAQAGALNLSASSLTHAGRAAGGTDLRLVLAGGLEAARGSLLLARNGTLDVSAGSWVNYGQAGAGGSLAARLTGDLYTDAASLLVAQGGGLTLTARNWTHAGEAAAFGNFSATLSGTLATLSGGTVTAHAGDLLLSAGALSHRGAVSAGRNATLSAGGSFETQAGSSVAVRSGLLTLNAGTWLHTGELKLSAGLDATVAGAFTTTAGSLMASQDGTLGVKAAVIHHDGRISSGGNISLQSERELRTTQTSMLTTSAGDISLAAGGTLVHLGGLGAGRDALLRSVGDAYNGGILAAQRDMHFALGGGLTNASTILTAENLTIGGLAAGQAAGAVVNDLGHIEAISGGISIYASSVTNRGTAPSVTTTETVSSEKIDKGRLKSFHLFEVTTTRRITEAFASAGSPAQMLAGGNLFISAGSILNEYSTISASGNIRMEGGSLINRGRELVEQTIVTTIQEVYKRKNGGKKLAYRYSNDLGTTTSSATIGSVPATIAAGGSFSGSFTGQVDNVSIRQNAGQVGQSSGAGVPSGSATDFLMPGQLPGSSLGSAGTVSGVAGSGGGVNASGTLAGSLAGTGAVSGSVSASGQLPAGASGSASGPVSGSSVRPATSATTGLPLPVLVLPVSALTIVSENPQAKFLFETRPEFVDLSRFYASDRFLDSLPAFNPDITQKRLGDAYVETNFIREQLLRQTGKRVLAGTYTDYDTVKQLYDNALTMQGALQLTPGVALTPEQIAALTVDVVWLEEAVVNGQKVLVPRLYLAPGNRPDVQLAGARITGSGVSLEAGSLTNSGSMIASNGMTLRTGGDLVNFGGTLSAATMDLTAGGTLANLSGQITGGSIRLTGQDIRNETLARTVGVHSGTMQTNQQRATITASGPLSLNAMRDLTSMGGTLSSGGDMRLSAGRDVKLETLKTETSFRIGGGRSSTLVDITSHQGSLLDAGGNLTVTAGRDLSVLGSTLAATGDTRLAAGGDVTIASAENRHRTEQTAKRHHSVKDHGQTVGSLVDTGGSLKITSGGDTAITASSLLAGENLAVAAAGNLSIEGANSTQRESYASKSSGFLRKKERRGNSREDVYTGSMLLAGGDVSLRSGQDLTVTGSSIIGGGDVALSGDNVTLTTGQAAFDSYTFEKKSGLFAGRSPGGSGFSVGYRRTKEESSTSGVTNIMSAISAGQNLTVTAAKDINATGTALLAGEDLTLAAGGDVNLLAATDSFASSHHKSDLFIGATVSAASPLIDAGNKIVSGVQGAAGKNGAYSVPVAALGAYKAVKAVQAAEAAAKAREPVDLGSISVMAGVSVSKSSSSSAAATPVVTTLQSGGDTLILAGTGPSGSGSIRGEGVQITAGVPGSALGAGNIILSAADDISLTSAQATSQSGFSSMQASIGAGVSFNVKLGQTPSPSFAFEASAASSKGGESTTSHLNSHVVGTGTVMLLSGGDTALKGAVASGEQVIVDAGGDLVIESRQDTASYRETSRSASVGGTIGGGVIGASGSASQSRITGDFASVGEQSGIVAGRGGYDVAAGGKVDLTGGVISSTAESGDNYLSARELAWRDVQNSSASSSSGFGVGFGVNFGEADTKAGKDVAARYPGTLTPIVNMPAREGESGTTRATVTPGTLELSDQRQDLASLNRDAGAAHVSVEAYDIARLKARQEGAAALSELLNGLTGDLSVKIGLKDGDPAKAALHAAVGAAVAAVAGTDIGAGAAAGLVSELANGVVSQMLKDHPDLTTAQQDAIRQWTATALGAAIGGQAGAAAALDNINHNYLKHEEQLIREKLKKQIRDCKADSACSEETLADLEHKAAYWDDLDQLRDDEWTSSCQASQTSSACVNATREALQAVGYLPTPGGPYAAAGGSEYNGYRDLEQRLKDGQFGGLSNQELAAAVYGERLETIELLKRYPDALREAYDGYVREGAYTAAFSIAGLLLTALPRRTGGGVTSPNSRQWDNWQPPAGYTRNADGTVTHNGSGQIYTPVRDASGNVRFDSRGNPVFNTQSAGSTAQTTLTQPSTSGPVINAPGPNTGFGGTKLREVSAAEANIGFGRPPYDPSKPIIDFVADGSTQYVRVYNTGPNSSQGGQWMMKADDIQGLTPQQIKSKFDLPELPTHITDVAPPQGTVIRVGTVNAENFGGNGGGTQFQLKSRIPESAFINPRPLN